MTTLVDYAKRFIGLPYIFGGQHPSLGFDCSGFIQIITQSVGVDPSGDQTAMSLYNYYVAQGAKSPITAGALLFYGKSTYAITHVAFAISEHQIVEAGGGDSTTTNVDRAIQADAFIRVRPANHRKDLVAVLMPKYPEWVLNG
jgi:cell wall-associated NlpC family hydrolase